MRSLDCVYLASPVQQIGIGRLMRLTKAVDRDGRFGHGVIPCVNHQRSHFSVHASRSDSSGRRWCTYVCLFQCDAANPQYCSNGLMLFQIVLTAS